MQVHKILAVQKLTTEHGWFTVITTRHQNLTVYNVGWIIDSSNTEAELTELTKDSSGQIEDCTITGTREQIDNLMYSLGYALPSKPNESIYINTVKELDRNLRYLLDEIKDLKNAQETATETF